MRATGDELSRLRRSAAALRRTAAAAVVAAATGAAAILFLVALWGSGASADPSPAGLAIALLLVVVAAGAGFVAGSARRRLELPRLAREAESAAGLAEGDVVSALELQGNPAYATSPLARLHEQRIGERLRSLPGAFFPVSARRWGRRLRLAVATCLIAGGAVILAAAAEPERAVRTVRSLATPWAVLFPPPLPPLTLLPGDTAVSRGSELPVRARAEGRREVRLFWRVEGEVASSRAVAVGAGGMARGRTGPITALTRYWVTDDRGQTSDTFAVRPTEPLLVTELVVGVVMPGYLGRQDEEHLQPVPPLVLPEGARLRIAGKANRPLDRVTLQPEKAGGNGAADAELEVEGAAFRGEVMPVRSGVWTWRLVPSATRDEIVPPLPLSLTIIPDSLPAVDIVYPGVDTVLHSDLQLPLVVDARDDIGIRRVELVSWRVSALGTKDETQRAAIGSGRAGETRIVARPTLDMRERNLLPGDTVYYYVRVRDGNPAHRAVASDTFRARLPSMAELREATTANTDRLAGDSRQLVEQARELEREAREAERKAASESARAGQSANATRDQRVSYEATEEARRVLQQAESFEERLADMQGRLEELRDEMAESGLGDPALREKLEQLEALYRELLESGLADEIARLQEALRSLDADELQRSLRQVAESIREMQDRLEQSTALLERTAVEQAVKSARMEAEQLARQQATTAAAESRDSSWAAVEDRLAAEAESLTQELEELAERLLDAGADAVADSARSAAERLESASRGMQQAARAARSTGQQSPADAQAGAGEAAQSTQEAAESLAEAERQLSKDWREEAMAAVRKALGESLELAREQSRLSGISGERLPPRSDHPARQLAVREGLDNLLRSLSEASKKTALLDQRTGPAAAQAAERLDLLLQRMQRTQGRSRPTPSEGRAIVSALNDLAAGLMATAQAIGDSESATGMQEALERLAQIAQTQQGVGQRTGGLLPLYQAGQRAQEQLSQLAREQAAVAERLRELAAEQGAGSEALGRPEEMAAEAEDIARQLTAGALDQQTVARQERLFRRLLDAGRSLEKEEKDPRKRESETATARARGAVRDLDPALLTGPRFPHPSQRTLSSYPPAYRALIFDYFDRLNEALPPARVRRP